MPMVRSLLLRGFAVVVTEAALRWPEALTLGVRTFGPWTPTRSRFGNAVTCGVYRCLWACAMATLSVGCCLSGVLETYGTVSSLLVFYWAAGGGLTVCGLGHYLLSDVRRGFA
ncbi:hypothetical protein [Oscillibacter sp.]|uniref:hypothetical protein n=1 Tax=Oscillibacter sp. TaxID=1945593 RepID=UPI003397BE16